MSLIQETFLETDWEEAEQAREARDQRAAQLEAQGLICSCSTLYRVNDGYRVFLVEAQTPEDEEESRKPPKKKSGSRRPKPKEGRSTQVDYR
ncbi:hypothetical protein C7271_16930 [filamentous cyanobacterium CCP5]|nr:hypothetical protein C7271_16930 [filamentous cyanobacterium CCP5]